MLHLDDATLRTGLRRRIAATCCSYGRVSTGWGPDEQAVATASAQTIGSTRGIELIR